MMDKNHTKTKDVLLYKCKNCEGELLTSNKENVIACPYCGGENFSTKILTSKFQANQYIPFSYDEQGVLALLKDYVGNVFLTPKTLKEQTIPIMCQKMFVPFLLHSLKDLTHYKFTGEQKIAHDVVAYNTTWTRHTERATTHNVYDLNIEAVGEFERVPTDASTMVDDELIGMLEPFDYCALTPYSAECLDIASIAMPDAKKDDLNKLAEDRIKSEMNKNASIEFSVYDGVQLQEQTHNIVSHTSEYVLLPIWIICANYSYKKCIFVVNGQTGKIIGHVPVNKLKMLLCGCISFSITAIAMYLIIKKVFPSLIVAIITAIVICGVLLKVHKKTKQKTDVTYYATNGGFEIVNKNETHIQSYDTVVHKQYRRHHLTEDSRNHFFDIPIKQWSETCAQKKNSNNDDFFW